jgi:hypothetical protein
VTCGVATDGNGAPSKLTTVATDSDSIILHHFASSSTEPCEF